MEQNKVKSGNVIKALQEISSEICDKYCKFPDMYTDIENEDEATELLIKMHCNQCPLVQFF